MNVLERLRKKIPLETRLNVNNEAFLINAIFELGYRTDEQWSSEDEETLKKAGKTGALLILIKPVTIDKKKLWFL